MNMIAIFAIFFSLLVGDEEKVAVQPVVVAKNESVAPSLAETVSLKLKSAKSAEFDIPSEWSDKIEVSTQSFDGFRYERHEIVLDPPTDCNIQILASDPSGKKDPVWESAVKMKSGQCLEDVASEMAFVGFRVKSSGQQKMIISQKFKPVTFDVAKKDFEKEVRIPYKPNCYIFPSGYREGTSEVFIIPAGFKFEAHLKGHRPIVCDYLKDFKPGKAVEMSSLGCFGSGSVTGSVTEDTEVIFRCHDYRSTVVVTIEPIKGFKKSGDKLASSTPTAKKE